MVRTLVFHTNNVGSIPTGLSILNKWIYDNRNCSLVTKRREPLRLRYELRFASLVSPWGGDLDEQFWNITEKTPRTRRVAFKKSYLIASWFKYLSCQKAARSKSSSPSIAILPSKSRCFTLTKAPMAHKTNSKEQFMFNFYNFKFSTTLSLPVESAPGSIGQGAHVLNLTKQLFPVFETNLLFLKYYSVSYPIKDVQFFRYL